MVHHSTGMARRLYRQTRRRQVLTLEEHRTQDRCRHGTASHSPDQLGGRFLSSFLFSLKVKSITNGTTTGRQSEYEKSQFPLHLVWSHHDLAFIFASTI